MDKDNINSTFKEYLIPFSSEFIMKQIRSLKLDSYMKKMDTSTCSKLFIFAQLTQKTSYTDISVELCNNEALQQELDLDSFSTSQLSRRFRDMNPALYESVYEHVIQKIHRQFGVRKGNEALGKINLIDASTISLCLTQYRWAEFRNTKAGIKLHTRVVYCEDENTTIPDKVVLTHAKPADRTQMDALVVREPDALNVFDRDYLDYDKFDEYSEEGTRFVTRLKKNAVITVLEEKPVKPDSSVIREAIVLLGNPKTHQMKTPVRLIETYDSKDQKVVIITNDMELSIEEISDVYRYRWHIELFFKWVKQHLHIKRFYGRSADAVYNQVRIALITFCLIILLKRKTAYDGRILDVQKLLCICWDEAFDHFMRKLHRKPERSSGGRQTFDHEQIFTETLSQYERNETDHLNDLTYDPIN